MPGIATPRLELVAITPEMIRADLEQSPELAELIGADVPPEWPPELWDRQALEYLLDKFTRYPELRGWSRFVTLKATDSGPSVLIGACGATGPVELVSDVEIGYGILPPFQRRGYATEAVRGLIEWIFSHANVRSVCAQTYPHLFASIRVLERNRFSFAGQGFEDGTILFRRHRATAGPPLLR